MYALWKEVFEFLTSILSIQGVNISARQDRDGQNRGLGIPRNCHLKPEAASFIRNV